jgi:putative SOS response-associated peptidase YedK
MLAPPRGSSRYILGMCRRFTNKMTWAEIVAPYRLTMNAPPHNLPPRYNICPADPIDVVREMDSQREVLQMRWGLVARAGR